MIPRLITLRRYNPRLQDHVLTGSLVVPGEVPPTQPHSTNFGESEVAESVGSAASYHWQRQYRMCREKASGGDGRGNYVFFVNEEKGVATYKEMAAQKLELRGGISAVKTQRNEELDSYTVVRRALSSAEARRRRLIASTVRDDIDIDEEDDEEDDGEVKVEEEKKGEALVEKSTSAEERVAAIPGDADGSEDDTEQQQRPEPTTAAEILEANDQGTPGAAMDVDSDGLSDA